MAKRQADLDSGVERMLALTKGDDESGRFIVTRGVTRPVWEPNAKTHGAVRDREAHRANARRSISATKAPAAARMRISPARSGSQRSTGSACAARARTRCSEHIVVDSLPQRARLMTGLLMEL